MRSYLYLGDYEYLKRIEESVKASKRELELSDGEDMGRIAQSGEKIHNAINNLIYLLRKREYGDHEWIRNQIREITYVDERTKIRLSEINDSLHANFYHRFLDYKGVKYMVEDAIKIINNILLRYKQG